MCKCNKNSTVFKNKGVQPAVPIQQQVYQPLVAPKPVAKAQLRQVYAPSNPIRQGVGHSSYRSFNNTTPVENQKIYLDSFGRANVVEEKKETERVYTPIEEDKLGFKFLNEKELGSSDVVAGEEEKAISRSIEKKKKPFLFGLFNIFVKKNKQ